MAISKKNSNSKTQDTTAYTLNYGDLLSTEEVANLFKVSIHTVRKWIENNSIPYYRITNKLILFPKQDLILWLNGKKISPSPNKRNSA